MEGNYQLFCNGISAGQAQVVRQALYYRIDCRCELATDEIFRVAMCWKDGWENLGVLVPEKGAFCLRKKIAANKWGREVPVFRIYRAGENPMDEFVPLDPDVPVDCMLRLKDARFARRDGRPGLLFSA